ncbi:FtsX-like permease family protein [Neisseriaceae bacterium TC5R-5]|nr:FtsX-like permease family protein [Neisseriaceae bacterium TC5R-5]
MKTWKLAWRNLLRNRRRTLATLLTMIIGMMGVLVFGGFDRAVQYSLQTAFVRGGGHLQIQHPDYLLYGSGNPAAYGIRDYQHIMRVISADPVLKHMLTVVTPVLSVAGIASRYASGSSHTVMVYGSEVSGQNQLRRWDDYQLHELPRPVALSQSEPNAAVLGGGVARLLQLCTVFKLTDCPADHHRVVEEPPAAAALPEDLAALAAAEPASSASDQIELLTATATGAPNIARLKVVKVEKQGAKELDEVYVGLHLAQAQKLLYGAGEPMVSAIVLQLQHSEQITAASARLQQLFATSLRAQPLVAHDFTVLQPLYGRIIDMFGTIFGFLAVLIVFIALFTIINTMNMAVLERTAEIGTLRSMGLHRAGIQHLFLCEGVLLGLAACLLGLVFSLLAAYLLNLAGLSWLPPGVVEPRPIVIRVWGEWRLIGAVMLGLLSVALLSAWWPARRAAQLNIVSALRYA